MSKSARFKKREAKAAKHSVQVEPQQGSEGARSAQVAQQSGGRGQEAPSKGQNFGEGNREADRNYREGVREFIDEGRVEPAAATARRVYNQDPQAAADAERAARRGPKQGT